MATLLLIRVTRKNNVLFLLLLWTICKQSWSFVHPSSLSITSRSAYDYDDTTYESMPAAAWQQNFPTTRRAIITITTTTTTHAGMAADLRLYGVRERVKRVYQSLVRRPRRRRRGRRTANQAAGAGGGGGDDASLEVSVPATNGTLASTVLVRRDAPVGLSAPPTRRSALPTYTTTTTTTTNSNKEERNIHGESTTVVTRTTIESEATSILQPDLPPFLSDTERLTIKRLYTLPPSDRNLTQLEEEFRGMLDYFSQFTEADLYTIRDPRLRTVFEGVIASVHVQPVYRAFEVLFEDLVPLRIAGRIIFKKLQQAMKAAQSRGQTEVDAIVATTGLPVDRVQVS